MTPITPESLDGKAKVRAIRAFIESPFTTLRASLPYDIAAYLNALVESGAADFEDGFGYENGKKIPRRFLIIKLKDEP